MAHCVLDRNRCSYHSLATSDLVVRHVHVLTQRFLRRESAHAQRAFVRAALALHAVTHVFLRVKSELQLSGDDATAFATLCLWRESEREV